MFNHNRAQLIHNINTLVEMSDYSIKVVIDGKEYWLQGVDEYAQRAVLQKCSRVIVLQDADETWEVLSETLLNQIALAALSQVGIPNE